VIKDYIVEDDAFCERKVKVLHEFFRNDKMAISV